MSKKDEDNEGGFEEYHSNNPRCTDCNAIIIGRVTNVLRTVGKQSKILPLCNKCWDRSYHPEKNPVCGHDVSSIVRSKSGTCYCKDCEDEIPL